MVTEPMVEFRRTGRIHKKRVYDTQRTANNRCLGNINTSVEREDSGEKLYKGSGGDGKTSLRKVLQERGGPSISNGMIVTRLGSPGRPTAGIQARMSGGSWKVRGIQGELNSQIDHGTFQFQNLLAI